jgi:hypothetical protein
MLEFPKFGEECVVTDLQIFLSMQGMISPGGTSVPTFPPSNFYPSPPPHDHSQLIGLSFTLIYQLLH